MRAESATPVWNPSADGPRRLELTADLDGTSLAVKEVVTPSSGPACSRTQPSRAGGGLAKTPVCRKPKPKRSKTWCATGRGQALIAERLAPRQGDLSGDVWLERLGWIWASRARSIWSSSPRTASDRACIRMYRHYGYGVQPRIDTRSVLARSGGT